MAGESTEAQKASKQQRTADRRDSRDPWGKEDGWEKNECMGCQPCPLHRSAAASSCRPKQSTFSMIMKRKRKSTAFIHCPSLLQFLVSRIYWSFGSLTCDSRGLPHDSPFVSELW